jgi:hypothetical protein
MVSVEQELAPESIPRQRKKPIEVDTAESHLTAESKKVKTQQR